MKNGLLKSLTFHGVILLIAVFGFPFVAKDASDFMAPLPVEIVDIADITQTNKPPAKPEASKPKPKEEKPEPEIEKPEPPKIEKPEPEPTPVKEEPKPEPVPKEEPKKELPKEEPKKEEKKPPEKKLEEKKPEEKKPEPKEEPKEEPKKDFSSLLKDLTPTEEESETPTPETPDSSPEPSPAALLSDKLTISELDAFKRQIEPCWNVPAGAKMAEDLAVNVRVEMNPDGTVRSAVVQDQSRYNRDTYYRAAADSALRALRNPQCSPLRLPADKYNVWKTIVMTFDPKDLL